MKQIQLFLFLTVALNPCFIFSQGQHSIVSHDSTIYVLRTDTITVHDDTAFVVVKLFTHDTLWTQWQQINLPTKSIFHGLQTSWHPNRQKRREGTYTFGTKNKDWRFWNEQGNEISEPKYFHKKPKSSKAYQTPPAELAPYNLILKRP